VAIFVGPQAYISPNWYESTVGTGEVVPTWKYITIHARGPVSFFTDESRLLGLVTRLTEKSEEGQESPWRVSEALADYVARELKATVGFVILVSSLEGKWKVGQNRPPGDMLGVVAGLRSRAAGDDLELAGEMSRDEGR
jgi:transcriptional regulator